MKIKTGHRSGCSCGDCVANRARLHVPVKFPAELGEDFSCHRTRAALDLLHGYDPHRRLYADQRWAVCPWGFSGPGGRRFVREASDGELCWFYQHNYDVGGWDQQERHEANPQLVPWLEALWRVEALQEISGLPELIRSRYASSGQWDYLLKVLAEFRRALGIPVEEDSLLDLPALAEPAPAT